MKSTTLTNCIKIQANGNPSEAPSILPVTVPLDESAVMANNAADLIVFSEPYHAIELIIIPDRYINDFEVLQTIQTRDNAYKIKQRGGIVMAAADAEIIVNNKLLPEIVLEKVYKISTIRHGFLTEAVDPCKDLLIKLAQCCVTVNAPLTEITIRCCHGAGSLDNGLFEPSKNQLIGHLGDTIVLSEKGQAASRAFLNGRIEAKKTNDDNYYYFKRLSIRTQTYTTQNVTLLDSNSPNVLYDMRITLDSLPELKHLSVKSYYGVVNPVPEEKQPPTRMGQWFSRDRPPAFFHPKAVRLLPSSNETTADVSFP